VRLLRAPPWHRAQLVRIRAVLDELHHELSPKEHGRSEPSPGATEGPRLGRGSLEAKLIRGHGPYLYSRFREGGHHRSVYVGKPGPAATS
jgi:hypothetical protein